MNQPSPEEEFQADLEAELAKLTPEERADLERRADFQEAIGRAPVLPIAFGVQAIQVDEDPAVVIMFQTPVFPGGARFVLPRAQALALASQIKKTAYAGPALVTPNGAGRLIVPGR